MNDYLYYFFVKIFVLLIVYQLKHFLADFPLQGKYMLGKFKSGWAFFLPLLAHVSVHGAMTFAIAWCVRPHLAVQLALTDMVIHFFMDRIKASPRYLGRYKALDATCYVGVLEAAEGRLPVPVTKEKAEEMKKWGKERLKSNVLFWWALGLDQMVHHFTHYYIIWKLVT